VLRQRKTMNVAGFHSRKTQLETVVGINIGMFFFSEYDKHVISMQLSTSISGSIVFERVIKDMHTFI
jgi:hypothetical protein